MPDNNIKISVIIPVYNRASTIKRCLDSVINQSYKADEIIVVDDGSADNSTKIIEKIDANINIIKLSQNKGAQRARNVGIKNANNDWIAFLDSDDEWLKNKLEKQVFALQKNNYNKNIVVHCNCYIKNNNQNKVYWDLPILEGDNILPEVLAHSAMLFPGLLTSKKSLIDINYLDENVSSFQEWDTAISLAHRCKFIHIKEPLFIYNQHCGKTISSNSINYFKGYQYIIKKHEQDIIKYCGENSFSRHIMTNAIFAMNSGNFKNGKKVLQDIKLFSLNSIVLKICAIFHIKPKYLISFRSFAKGLV